MKIVKKAIKTLLISFIAIISVLLIYFFVFINFNVNVDNSELTELTSEQKVEDFNYLYNYIKDNYPYIEVSKRKTGYDWLANKDFFEKMILQSKSNKDFYHSLQKILYMLQNAHTHIIEPSTYEMYKDIYKGSGNFAWKKIISNKNVEKKYLVWQKIINDEIKAIPLIIKYVEGNYVAYDTIEKNNFFENSGIPKFSILLEVDGMDVDKYIVSNMDRYYLSYDFNRKKLKNDRFIIYCDDNEIIKLKFKTLDGKIIEKNLMGQKIDFDNNENKSNMPEKLYETEIIKPDKIAYIKVWSFAYNYVDKDRQGIYTFFESIKNYPYLIIDIRGNGGGSENYYAQNLVAPLIDKALSAKFYMLFRNTKQLKPFLLSRGIITTPISKLPEGLNYPQETKYLFSGYLESNKKVFPKNPVGFKGKIFLLVDDYVYSSAETFAALCKATGFATIVGTTTGGDGIGIDPGVLVMPNSGLVVRFSMEMGLNPDGTCNEEYHTQPDIFVEQTLDDFIKYVNYKENNRDAVVNPYDTVLNHVISIIN